MKRRIFLKGSLATGAIGLAVGAGLITPRMVLAAWPKTAFEAKNVDGALNGLFGRSKLTATGKIRIKAPDIAENGAVVPISVEADIEGVKSISILADKNPTPLTSSYVLGKGTQPYIATRIKMGKTGKVIAVVKTADRVYSAAKEVKVTIGGCGG